MRHVHAAIVAVASSIAAANAAAQPQEPSKVAAVAVTTTADGQRPSRVIVQTPSQPAALEDEGASLVRPSDGTG